MVLIKVFVLILFGQNLNLGRTVPVNIRIYAFFYTVHLKATEIARICEVMEILNHFVLRRFLSSRTLSCGLCCIKSWLVPGFEHPITCTRLPQDEETPL